MATWANGYVLQNYVTKNYKSISKSVIAEAREKVCTYLESLEA